MTAEWEDIDIFTCEEAHIDTLQSARCSVCNKYHTTPYLYYFYHYKYCPNCGARLDGEGENDEA